MSAVRRHFGNIGGGWLDAWSGWRENPLWTAWERGLALREERVAWWRRSPGLTILGALLALGATAVNIALLVDTLSRFNQGGERPFIAANLSLAVGVVLASAGLFCLCWLTARLYRVMQFALGFLEREPRQTFRNTLDDMLAVSSISEQELLLGCTWFGLRQLVWPLLACCGCAAVFAGRMLGAAGTASDLSGAWSVTGQALGLFAMLAVSGLLAATVLLLLGVSLSLAPRAGVLPSIGAANMVLMQPLFMAAGVYFALMQRSSGEIEAWYQRLGYGAAASASFVLSLFLLFYLARRMDSIRMALAGALPFVLVLPYGIVSASLAISLGGEYGTTLPLAQPLELLTLLNPSLLATYFTSSSTAADLGGAAVRWVGGLAVQLVLLWVAAEMARDAVRRRKWGEAG